MVLAGVWQEVRPEFGTHLARTIEATEIALSEPIPAGQPELEAARIASLRRLGEGGGFFASRFLGALEHAFQHLPEATSGPTASPMAPDSMPATLRLIEEDEGDDDRALLDNMASRLASRNSLALQLLGQRFGVLARSPAFEPEQLPMGPQILCNALQDGIAALDLSPGARRQLVNQFARTLVDTYPALLDACNDALARAGILPCLSFVPGRRIPGTPASTDPAEARGGQAAAIAEADASPESQASARIRSSLRAPIDASFATLQTLLQRRRTILSKLRPAASRAEGGKTLPALDHNEVLDALKRLRANHTRAESVQEYRQILLAQARQQHGHGVTLSESDNDSFDLLALFLAQIQRGLRRASPGQPLMDRLFLPMVLSALRDPTFFTDERHPARELLDAVSLAGARWLGEDDLDAPWLGLLQRAVASVQHDETGSESTIAEANQTLQSGLQTLLRKAEMAERRQVEAARGRERLAVARKRAADTIAGLVGDRTLPAFHAALLEHAWVDVMSLSYLRGGDDSEAWRRQQEAARCVIDSAFDPTAIPTDSDLAPIREGLEQVGYHPDDVLAVLQALGEESQDGHREILRAELRQKLDARARLGEDAIASLQGETSLEHPAELQAYERLRSITMPAWIEFRQDPDHPLRRRLAWVGETSGQALLVNRRGLRAEEETLAGLARKLAAGHAELLEQDHSPAKAAWDTTLEGLLPMASGEDEEGSHGS